MFAERSPPPPRLLRFFTRPFLPLFSCLSFSAFEYLLPDTGYVSRSFGFSDCFSLCFPIFVCAFFQSCVFFAGESLLPCAPKCRSDGGTSNIKIWYVRTVYNAPARTPTWTSHHRQTLHVFFQLFLVFFFCVDDRNHPRPIQFCAPIAVGNEAKVRIFWPPATPPACSPYEPGGGLLAKLRSALIASLGQYTAAVQYTGWFLRKYNRYWPSQQVPSPSNVGLEYLRCIEGKNNETSTKIISR